MSLDYFYCPPENIQSGEICIDGDEFSHLTHVMRKREGDVIRVIDGKGVGYDVELISLTKRAAQGKIISTFPGLHEPHVKVTVAVGLLKNPSRFDFLIEKATEIGAHEIIPLVTSRTIPKHTKIERWQKLALAAMKQSCRSYLPIIHNGISLEQLMSSCRHFNEKYIFHEKAAAVFKRDSRPPLSESSCLLLIGPEGGFSDEEVERSLEHGCTAYSLGARRLRTETAAVVAMAFVLNDESNNS